MTVSEMTLREQLELEGFDEVVRQARALPEKAFQSVVRRAEKTRELLTEVVTENDLSFLHSGLCQTCLPHSKPQSNTHVWKRQSGRFTLMVQPGVMHKADHSRRSAKSSSSHGDEDYVGVPYGSKARLIMIYLQTEGLKSRVVNLGDSQTAFMRSLGLQISGGERGTIQAFKEQTLRLTRCRFVLQWDGRNESGDVGTTITDSSITDGVEFWNTKDGGWSGSITLDERFYESLKNHAVPLDKRGIAYLSGNSLGLDLYALLAYRLPRLSKSLDLSWAALQQQLGADMKQHRQLGARIRDVLPDVLAAYPQAKVEVIARGLRLLPSPCVVPRTQVNGFRLVE